MASIMLKWSNLFNLPELDFEGAFPPVMTVEEDIQITLAWLTAADRTERKLVRCDSQGALLMSDPWNGFNPVETGILEVNDNVEDTVTFTTDNKGVLFASDDGVVQVFFKRLSGGADEEVYIPGHSFYWYPHTCYSVRARCVPYATGGAHIHGVTAFN